MNKLIIAILFLYVAVGVQAQSVHSEHTSNSSKQTKSHSSKPRAGHTKNGSHQAGKSHGRIPEDKFRSNFGEGHRFHVSEGDFRNHRFAYGGYSFGFIGIWPYNWLYTQDVYVCMVGDVYYLCNPMYPGVTVQLEVE